MTSEANVKAGAERGLLLAAHRAFRTHINTRCGQLKGECTKAAMDLRENLNSVTARNKEHVLLQQWGDFKNGLHAFGPPASVPESGASEYVSRKRNELLTAYHAALEAVSQASVTVLLAESSTQDHRQGLMVLARNTGGALAYKELLDRFEGTFGAIENQLQRV
jgi:hypothetical protein